MILVTIFRWGYKPTYNWGGPSCMVWPLAPQVPPTPRAGFRAAPPAACLCCERLSSPVFGGAVGVVLLGISNGTYPLVICYIAIENGHL